MTKELQDHVWSILPKEFKLEVKKEYRKGYVCETLTMLITLFGRHNLTSDAEGEEMLTVEKGKVQFMFDGLDSTRVNDEYDRGYKAGKEFILHGLFGPKCLPDNVESSEPNVDSLPQNPTENCDNKSHISADCNKPAEPKFKIGDKVKDISSPHDGGIYKVDDIKKSSNGFIYHIQGLIGKSNVKESDLEPYTEPTAKNPKESPKAFASDEPTATGSDDFDRIVNDGFRGHNRLHIATQITASIYSNDKAASQFNSIEALVRKALDIADTLIAEVEKGAER